jgi:hypothetical protein
MTSVSSPQSPVLSQSGGIVRNTTNQRVSAELNTPDPRGEFNDLTRKHPGTC